MASGKLFSTLFGKAPSHGSSQDHSDTHVSSDSSRQQGGEPGTVELGIKSFVERMKPQLKASFTAPVSSSKASGANLVGTSIPAYRTSFPDASNLTASPIQPVRDPKNPFLELVQHPSTSSEPSAPLLPQQTLPPSPPPVLTLPSTGPHTSSPPVPSPSLPNFTPTPTHPQTNNIPSPPTFPPAELQAFLAYGNRHQPPTNNPTNNASNPQYHHTSPSTHQPQYHHTSPSTHQPQYQQHSPSTHQPQYQQHSPTTHQPQYQQHSPSTHQPQYQQHSPSTHQPQYQQHSPSTHQPQYQQHSPSTHQPQYQQPATSISTRQYQESEYQQDMPDVLAGQLLEMGFNLKQVQRAFAALQKTHSQIRAADVVDHIMAQIAAGEMSSPRASSTPAAHTSTNTSTSTGTSTATYHRHNSHDPPHHGAERSAHDANSTHRSNSVHNVSTHPSSPSTHHAHPPINGLNAHDGDGAHDSFRGTSAPPIVSHGSGRSSSSGSTSRPGSSGHPSITTMPPAAVHHGSVDRQITPVSIDPNNTNHDQLSDRHPYRSPNTSPEHHSTANGHHNPQYQQSQQHQEYQQYQRYQDYPQYQQHQEQQQSQQRQEQQQYQRDQLDGPHAAHLAATHTSAQLGHEANAIPAAAPPRANAAGPVSRRHSEAERACSDNLGRASSGFREDGDKLVCKICLEAQSCIALAPCGHLGLCEPCAGGMASKACPFCRKEVAMRLRVFWP